MDDIVRYYDKSKNPEHASLPGVPLRDLERSEFESFPKWLQKSIDACIFYRKTKPPESLVAPEATPTVLQE